MLNRRVALVTGSTQGIGWSVAQVLARAGARVVLHGIEPQARGQALAEELVAKAGVPAAYVQADLADAAQAEALVDAATAALGPPDILVNNAGIQHTCPIERFPRERWDAILAVNLSAAFLAMKAAVPGMRQRGWGRIVNIASVLGVVASAPGGLTCTRPLMPAMSSGNRPSMA
ncbi:MAG TPA: SDR family NAD(P)-dependent oxidoreductase, partial [Rubrivivax sp.]|nr:SDR family NAD(P)-dependent oxidoreductase [Rubrivivax sp.]